ncbi:hypothetical protein ALC62_12744, partial [Cyphomyrmex costatus]
IECKIEVDRIIKKCEMFSHTLDVQNDKFSYIQETSCEACQRMHVFGYFRMGYNIYINEFKSNQSVSRSVTLAGHVNNERICDGDTYSDPCGTWTGIMVLAILKFTLPDYEAKVRLNSNKVLLRSGVTCEFSTTHFENRTYFLTPQTHILKPITKPIWKYVSWLVYLIGAI